MNDKINEAHEILYAFNLPVGERNVVSALTLLALCNIAPDDEWRDAERISRTVNEIMDFANLVYETNYAKGSREFFRKGAVYPFLDHGIIEKNPDNPDLSANSPMTHYAISNIFLNTIRKFGTEEWQKAVENFLRINKDIQDEKDSPAILIKNVNIISYKSIENDSIDLGRFNVFIGANGCGKSNILEAIATVGAERANDLNFEGLHSRGVRIARPDLILSAFLEGPQKSSIDIDLSVEIKGKLDDYRCSLSPTNMNDIYTKWVNLAEEEFYPEALLSIFGNIAKQNLGITGDDLLKKANELLEKNSLRKSYNFDNLLSDYAIFDLNTKALRGIAQSDSKKVPLGINGEGLDLLISNFSKGELEQLKLCMTFFEWLDEIITDKKELFKNSGLKAGRSTSTLYFKDKFMQRNNNMLSAEYSNEGVLHVLFYLALFISRKTPKLFAIDNIETALNPRLCYILIKELTRLAKANEKQVLITTHNPAILDGLNLFDEEQRLFEVYRDNDGKTKTRRIQFKRDLSDKKFKLSEMWLNGLLGAMPKNF